MFKMEFYVLPELGPRCEPPHFTVVAIHGQVKLWPDEQNLTIVEDHTAVVTCVLVHHWPRVIIVILAQ